jgi:DNA invertase Pin-like site-specific DNA recombinase
MAVNYDKKNTKTAVAYVRVSTKKQEISGLGLADQQQAVKAFCVARGLTLLGEPFVEIESGKMANRAQLAKALIRARRTRSVLVVSTLTRLSRDLALVTQLVDGKVPFVAADAPEDDAMVTQMKAVFAGEELRKISTRTKAALAVLKDRGVQLGKPENLTVEGRKTGSVRGGQARAKRAAEDRADLLPEVRELREQGLGLRAIAEQIGGVSAATLSRLLRRSAEVADEPLPFHAA